MDTKLRITVISRFGDMNTWRGGCNIEHKALFCLTSWTVGAPCHSSTMSHYVNTWWAGFSGGPVVKTHAADAGSTVQSLVRGLSPMCLVAQPRDVKRKNTLMKQGIRKEGWATGSFPGHSGAAMGSANSDFSRHCLGINLGVDLANILPTSLSFLVHELMVLLILHLPPAAYISWFVEREDTWAANKHFGSFHLLLPVSFLLWIGFVLEEKIIR